MKKNMNIALIFAGGTGIRMSSKTIPKQFLQISGKPILIYTLECFDSHPEIDLIIVICLEAWLEELKQLIKRWQIKKVKWVVAGGNTSQDSIYEGLCILKENHIANGSVVLIHDGVRPLIDASTISQSIEMVRINGNCVTVAREHETFIQVDGENCIKYIGARGFMRVAKAPQSFLFSDILHYHEQARTEGKHNFIDSASLAYFYDTKLHTIECENSNIKITTSFDYYIFRALQQARENNQIYEV